MLWQQLAQTSLNPAGIETIMGRPEIKALAALPFEVVERAGQIAQDRRANNALRMFSDWLATANELVELSIAQPPPTPPSSLAARNDNHSHLSGAIPLSRFDSLDPKIIERISIYPSDVQISAMREIDQGTGMLSLSDLADACQVISLRRRSPAKRRSPLRRTDAHGVPYGPDEDPQRAIEREIADRANG